jgi:hypothetical protein
LGSAWQVGIEGDVDGGVAEELLHVLAIHALYEQQRDAGVPKIRTPTEQGKEPLENRFEGAGGEMLSVHRFPTFVGKREIVFLPNLGQEV